VLSILSNKFSICSTGEECCCCNGRDYRIDVGNIKRNGGDTFRVLQTKDIIDQRLNELAVAWAKNGCNETTQGKEYVPRSCLAF
jgi:hypothetical protein